LKLKTAKAQFAVEFIDLPLAAQVEGAEWEPFQISLLNNDTRFGIYEKCRQIAFSFATAVDALADSVINPGWPHIFVSINLEEAQEKIRYARNILAAMDEPVRPELASPGSKTKLEFTNGSRLISYPCRPVRGPAGGRIYLDEMAHYIEGRDRDIYKAALPSTTKGDGYMRIGSSPLGASGMFWEISSQELKAYPGYNGNRHIIPWWTIKAFCLDVKVAQFIAAEMTTEQRVCELGTPAIIEIFENMFLEDFQQEYECVRVDESVAWISWDIIKRNQAAHDGVCFHAKSVADVMQMIPQVQAAIHQRKIEVALVGGLDVGRKKNLTELVLLGKSTAGRLPVRFCVSLDRVEYDDQQSCFRHIIAELPIIKILVDENGIGAQLAENLSKTGKAEGATFTNASKELWAVEGRIQMERGNVPLPSDRELAYQIHSIKKKVSAARNNIFDTDRNERHHADKTWALFLAIAASGKELKKIRAWGIRQ
jgi:phage FluMu gp28-like protein